MKKLILLSVFLFISSSTVFAAFNTVTCKVNNVVVEAKDRQDCESIGGEALNNYMFVINFDTGSYKDGKLRLNGNGTSNVIYFTDRPDRESGHMSVKKFKSIWTKGINSFKSDPPNATLSAIIKGKDSNSIMIISNPVVIDSSIEFDVKEIEGIPPASFNTGGLFIDPLEAGIR